MNKTVKTDHRCNKCRDDDHSSHQPWAGGICIGCSCDVTP